MRNVYNCYKYFLSQLGIKLRARGRGGIGQKVVENYTSMLGLITEKFFRVYCLELQSALIPIIEVLYFTHLLVMKTQRQINVRNTTNLQ